MSSEKDWSEGHDWSLFHEDKPRKTMAPYWVIVAILFGIAAALVSYKLRAEPIARMGNHQYQITLHKEKCAVPAVTNLPQRATWTENGKTFEGCFGVDEELRIVVFYFEDKTVAAIPQRAFKAVIES